MWVITWLSAAICHLTKCLSEKMERYCFTTVTCSSATIHLAKCMDWSLIKVISQTEERKFQIYSACIQRLHSMYFNMDTYLEPGQMECLLSLFKAINEYSISVTHGEKHVPTNGQILLQRGSITHEVFDCLISAHSFTCWGLLCHRRAILL